MTPSGTAHGVTFRPLSPVVGAEVIGLDASRELAPEVVETLLDAAAAYGVLLFRDQHLDTDEQRRFSRYFGDLAGGFVGDTIEKRAGGQSGATTVKEVLYVGNLTVEGEQGIIPSGELQFHSDGLYTERPAKGTLLYAIEIPSSGGNTLFASTAHAFATLAPALRERLIGLDIDLIFDYTTTVRTTNPPADAPRFVHPLVIEHPRSGQALLNCNRLMATTILGAAPAESAALIAMLCDHVERREFVYEHAWRVGDLLFWDNLATVHARTDFDPAQRRWLRRTTIKGERPRRFGASVR